MDINQIILEKTGKKPINIAHNTLLWKSWYRGKVDGFHDYRLYNGENYMDVQKKSLTMAKTVAEDWADLLANEKTKITIPEKQQEKLDAILEDNSFLPMLNDGIEKTFALGNGAFVLGVTNFQIGEKTGIYKPTEDTEVSIEFFDAEKMYPLNIEKRKITECAFVSEATEYTEVSCHIKEVDMKGRPTNKYIIKNFKIKKENGSLTDMIYDEYQIKTENCWFFAYKPNINNNMFDATDLSNNLGISIYANAIDVLKSIDNIYDGFDTEFVLLRAKAFVNADAYTVNMENGQKQISFDPYNQLFYRLPNDTGSLDGENKPVQYEVPQIREQSYINGINTQLNLLSKKVGFGNERYKFDKGGVITATQIISENSDMARSLKKQENSLSHLLKDLTWSIVEVNNSYTHQEKIAPFEYTEIQVDFDDSIIQDENAIKEHDRADVQAGLMTVAEYRAKHMDKTTDDAEDEQYNEFLYTQIDKYINALQQGVMTAKEFVVKTRGEENPELEAYIEEHLKQASANVMDMWGESNEDEDKDNPEPNKEPNNEEQEQEEEKGE